MTKKVIQDNYLFLFFCLLWIASLVFSPFLLTMSMMGIWLMGIYFLIQKIRKGETTFKQFLLDFSKDPIAVLVIFFLITLFGYFYSANFDYWLERLRLRMLFLFLPFSFFALPKISKKGETLLLYFLISLMVGTNIWIGIQYFLNFDDVQKMLSRGQSIPTPRNHIRYNLILAISIISGIYLWVNDRILRFQWEKQLVGIATIFSFLFIHVLAVRSGIVALYLALIVLLVQYVITNRKYLLGLLGFLLLFIIGFGAVKNIPSLKNKLDYVKWDYISSQKGNLNERSDGERWASQKLGYKIFKENPISGIGPGDLKNEMNTQYQLVYGDKLKAKMPHNQYISILAKSGLVGFLAFAFASLLPLFYKKNYQNILLLGFYIIIFASFLVENTIENAIGAGIYTFFVILGLRRKD